MALNRLTGAHPEFVRQRQGSKAMEYHIDCLPDAAPDAVRRQYFAAVLAQSVKQDAINIPVEASSFFMLRGFDGLFGDDYQIINEAFFLPKIDGYCLRSCI
ncbi:hypothetical protein [Xenorhabdus miraniensis]|uniref:Transposase n=1 Tax=Xenorhabdus miraniensis TaxID=351674 RepID=A0A2D0JMD5_9GAMM|nr:hypothetical protein [Xenorhabdus miraniensis]PHM47453.1 transposase [Xenorhabdus miraniensis]